MDDHDLESEVFSGPPQNLWVKNVSILPEDQVPGKARHLPDI